VVSRPKCVVEWVQLWLPSNGLSTKGFVQSADSTLADATCNASSVTVDAFLQCNYGSLASGDVVTLHTASTYPCGAQIVYSFAVSQGGGLSTNVNGTALVACNENTTTTGATATTVPTTTTTLPPAVIAVSAVQGSGNTVTFGWGEQPGVSCGGVFSSPRCVVEGLQLWLPSNGFSTMAFVRSADSNLADATCNASFVTVDAFVQCTYPLATGDVVTLHTAAPRASGCGILGVVLDRLFSFIPFLAALLNRVLGRFSC
jgi:hypothetical protein